MNMIPRVPIQDMRPYQYEAYIYLCKKVLDEDVKSLGLIAPTGAGKTLILQAIIRTLTESRNGFRGVVLAAPTKQTERGFYKSITLMLHPPYTGALATELHIAKDMFTYPRENIDSSSKEHYHSVLSGRAKLQKVFLTTHMQLAIYGTQDLPENLDRMLLVLDEAHHAGTDKTSDTGIGEYSRVWRERGGTVLYTTATPFRADEKDVLPEGTVTWTRPIALHSEEKFAPSDFQIVAVDTGSVATTSAEIAGDALSQSELESGLGYQAMVQRWLEDGKPKAVFVVPAGVDGKARKWAGSLVKAIEAVAPGTRVVDAVGTDEETCSRFQEALLAEGDVASWSESKVDVFIACKRFDEGTDWPLCTHMYNYGLPSSFGLILQRWGRTFRLKDRYADYPESLRDKAVLVFFTLQASKEAFAEYEAQHHDFAYLIACFLSDWETGCKYRQSMRSRFNQASKTSSSEEELLEAIEDEQVHHVSDLARAKATALIAECEAQTDNGSVTYGAVLKYLNELAASKSHDKDMSFEEVRLAVHQILTERLSESDRDVVESEMAKVMPKHPVRSDLLAAFDEVVSPYRDRTVSVVSSVASILSRFSGRDASEIARLLRGKIEKPDLTEDMIRVAGQKFFDRNGKWPNQKSGDATADFGFKETWVAVNSCLVFGGRGFVSGSSLVKFFHGRKDPIPDMTEDMLRDAVEKFKLDKGVYPKPKDGDAFEYLGFHITWCAIDHALNRGRYGLTAGSSLSFFCKGYSEREGFSLSEKELTQAISVYQQKNGRDPSCESGDATEYFGRYIQWYSVDQALKHGWHGLPKGSSLFKFIQAKGINLVKLTHDSIREACLNFKLNHGSYPTRASGDAFKYFGFPISWVAVDLALRRGSWGLPKGFSLPQILGLVKDITLSESLIFSSAQKFKEDLGRYPNQKDGDATEYFGFCTTWSAIDHALHRGSWGLIGGSSLAHVVSGVKRMRRILSVDMLQEAILSYKKDTGKCPKGNSGDATKYFGFYLQWHTVDGSLRHGYQGLPKGSSLSKFIDEHGLR